MSEKKYEAWMSEYTEYRAVVKANSEEEAKEKISEGDVKWEAVKDGGEGWCGQVNEIQ